jgi:hypothetical protein
MFAYSQCKALNLQRLLTSNALINWALLIFDGSYIRWLTVEVRRSELSTCWLTLPETGVYRERHLWSAAKVLIR